jgi:endonuclease/exonuclease/phosphatase (EEP) superfamily protein YafD
LRDVVGDGVLWLCAAVWLAFLLGLAGRWWWIADLLAAFRIHYAVLFAVVVVIAAPLRRFGVVVTALAGTLITGGSILPYLRTADPVPAPEAFRFVTFNKYWRNPDAVRIGAYLDGSRADVIALQEVESEATVSTLAQHMPSYPFRYVSADRNRTTVMFSRSPIRDSGTIELVPGGASAARLVVEWRGHLVTVVGVHLHWPIGAENVRLRNAELARLAQLPQEIPGPLLIGGDFNVTAWSTVFSAALADSGLSDCARGQGLVQTWPAQVPLLAIRIDQCLHSRHWQVAGVSHGPALGSDHYPTLNELVLRD